MNIIQIQGVLLGFKNILHRNSTRQRILNMNATHKQQDAINSILSHHGLNKLFEIQGRRISCESSMELTIGS